MQEKQLALPEEERTPHYIGANGVPVAYTEQQLAQLRIRALEAMPPTDEEYEQEFRRNL